MYAIANAPYTISFVGERHATKEHAATATQQKTSIVFLPDFFWLTEGTTNALSNITVRFFDMTLLPFPLISFRLLCKKYHLLPTPSSKEAARQTSQ